jgi:hypothetical protein
MAHHTLQPVTEHAIAILAFCKKGSDADKAKVRKWLDDHAGRMPLALFVRSGKTDHFRKIIQDLLIS